MSHEMSRIVSRRMISAAAAIAIALGATSVVHAAPTPDAPPTRGDRPRDGDQGRRPMMQVLEDYRTLIESLKLDGDQARQLRDVMQSTRESMRSLAQDAQTMSPQDRLASFNEAIDTLNGKIGDLLNDEQKKAFEKGTADIRAKAIENFKQQAGRPNRDGATSGPSTRPGGGPGGAGGGPGGPGGGRMAERVQRAMDDAGLTDDQKEKMKPLLDEAREKIRSLIADARDKGAADPQAMREQVREIYDEVAKKADFLSAEQIEKLKAALQQRPDGQGGQGGGRRGPNGGGPGDAPMGDRPDGGGPRGGGPNGDGPKGDNPPPPPPPGDKPAAAGPARPTDTAMNPPNEMNPEAGNNAGLAASTAQAKQKAPAEKSNATTRPTLAVGDLLPAFSLTKLDGRAESNQSIAHKPTVIIFGSYTAPSFRDHMPLLLQLARRYSTRVNWLIVYTREMHPAGADEPERNRDDNITVAAHKTIADRIAAAKTAKDQLQINLDVAPDAIDDPFTNACSGFPNAALLVDRDGRIAARQEWADAFALERAIDRELKKR